MQWTVFIHSTKRWTCTLLNCDKYNADLVVSSGIDVAAPLILGKKFICPSASSNTDAPETFSLSRFTDGCLVSGLNPISIRYSYFWRYKRASISTTWMGLSCQ